MLGPAFAGMAVLALATVSSQFMRSANAVIAPDLMAELALGPAEMGILTGGFFIAFALVQIPSGMAFDRFGVRRTTALLMVLAVAGALVFSLAESLGGLLLGRVLMGAGLSTTLMAGFVLATRWYPRERFGRVAGTYAAVGNLGNLVATAPLAAVAVLFGWRGAFTGMAAIIALLAVLVWLVVRDAPRGHPVLSTAPEGPRAVLAGVVEVTRIPGIAHTAAIAFVVLGVQLSVLSLWAGPYLHDVHGLDTIERGNVLLLMAVAMACGTFAHGALERWVRWRNTLVRIGATNALVLLLALGLWPDPDVLVASVLLVLFGGLASYGVAVSAYSRCLYPDRLMGRGITSINFVMVSGIAILQIATGYLIAAFPPTAEGNAPETAYRAVFLFLGAVLALALVAFMRAPLVPVRAADPGGR